MILPHLIVGGVALLQLSPSSEPQIILLTALYTSVALLFLAQTMLLVVTRRGIINIVLNKPSQNIPALGLERQTYPCLINNYTHA